MKVPQSYAEAAGWRGISRETVIAGANALARYGLQSNSFTMNSENSLAFKIVLRAAEAINGKSTLPNVTAKEFEEFKTWAQRDGFVFDGEDEGIPEIPAADRVVTLDHNSSA